MAESRKNVIASVDNILKQECIVGKNPVLELRRPACGCGWHRERGRKREREGIKLITRWGDSYTCVRETRGARGDMKQLDRPIRILPFVNTILSI